MLQIQSMMKENETLPEIEKLARQEFDLHVDQQEQLQAEANAEINRVVIWMWLSNYLKYCSSLHLLLYPWLLHGCWFPYTQIREEKQFDNLAKMYLADLIRKQCWDDMDVKGRGILVRTKSQP